MCPNRDRHLDWTTAERWGSLVNHLTSLLRTCWCQLIPSSILRHHWSSGSILRTSFLVTAQHSEPYRKIGRMQVLYSFNFVWREILDFQIWLSRFCIDSLLCRVAGNKVALRWVPFVIRILRKKTDYESWHLFPTWTECALHFAFNGTELTLHPASLFALES